MDELEQLPQSISSLRDKLHDSERCLADLEARHCSLLHDIQTKEHTLALERRVQRIRGTASDSQRLRGMGLFYWKRRRWPVKRRDDAVESLNWRAGTMLRLNIRDMSRLCATKLVMNEKNETICQHNKISFIITLKLRINLRINYSNKCLFELVTTPQNFDNSSPNWELIQIERLIKLLRID